MRRILPRGVVRSSASKLRMSEYNVLNEHRLQTTQQVNGNATAIHSAVSLAMTNKNQASSEYCKPNGPERENSH